jgi:hypothetical protein
VDGPGVRALGAMCFGLAHFGRPCILFTRQISECKYGLRSAILDDSVTCALIGPLAVNVPPGIPAPVDAILDFSGGAGEPHIGAEIYDQFALHFLANMTFYRTRFVIGHRFGAIFFKGKNLVPLGKWPGNRWPSSEPSQIVELQQSSVHVCVCISIWSGTRTKMQFDAFVAGKNCSVHFVLVAVVVVTAVIRFFVHFSQSLYT